MFHGSYFAISGPIRNPQQLVFIGVGVCDQGKRRLDIWNTGPIQDTHVLIFVQDQCKSTHSIIMYKADNQSSLKWEP